MFRCPHCAQVYRLRISPNYSILSNRDMNSFQFIDDKVFDDGVKKKNIFRQMIALLGNIPLPEEGVRTAEQCIRFAQAMAQHLGDEPFDLENDEVACYYCGEADSIANHIEAFEKPELHFDAENLCGCGEELWMDAVIQRGRRVYALTCDKCGWVKPGVALSGSGDSTQS